MNTKQVNNDELEIEDKIKELHHELIRTHKKQNKRTLHISKMINISKNATLNYDFRNDKEQYIKEYIIKRYYKRYYPVSLEIRQYHLEKVEYGLNNILSVQYNISEEDYTSNLRFILEDYISD